MFMTRVTALAFLAVTLAAQPNPQEHDTPRLVQARKGRAIQKELAGGQSHSYAVRLKAGQFLRGVVTQLGIDVIVRLFAPDGQSLAEVNTIASTQGQEALVWIAQASGTYRLEISAQNPAANPGRYEIKVAERRTAVAEDHKRVAALLAFREGQNWAAKYDYDGAIPARAGTEGVQGYSRPSWRGVQPEQSGIGL